jgi:hypothetical protein
LPVAAELSAFYSLPHCILGQEVPKNATVDDYYLEESLKGDDKLFCRKVSIFPSDFHRN